MAILTRQPWRPGLADIEHVSRLLLSPHIYISSIFTDTENSPSFIGEISAGQRLKQWVYFHLT